MTGHHDILVDSNVVIYAYDPADAWKQQRAIVLLDRVAVEDRGVVSTQVVNEYYNGLRKRISPPLSAVDAEDACRDIMRMFWVWPAGAGLLLDAMRAARRYGFNYWDALIWAAAREAAASTVLTEDFTDGSTIEGVTFLNPFTESFDLDALLAR